MLSTDKPIILNGYSGAVFLAIMKCVDENPWILRKQQWRMDEFNKSQIITHNGKLTIVKSNPNYKPLTEEEIAEKDKIKAQADKFQNEWVYKYLKEQYPNKDYAETFKNNKINV